MKAEYILYDTEDKELPVAIGNASEIADWLGTTLIDFYYHVIIRVLFKKRYRAMKCK